MAKEKNIQEMDKVVIRNEIFLKEICGRRWCLRLVRYLFDTFIAEDYGEYGASGRFEPPTARFVAEYSIQLSYG